ncbi:hypothetical protein [Geobacter sp. DSM 9736]|uniref:hypothetical protein n=1 Tax=Geobacter sp. DSM 9736 TaxID=1277350 RepID=UPI000B504CA1|nr:hypothetical protein [Geobacter sp. DSM 9736]SNB46742.1 hypothetical protein SAMN06269301_2212 [Geobacter sp. DSM 9736]
MKQPIYFILGFSVLVCGFVLIAAYSLLPVGLLVTALGVILMVHWNTVNYRWVCDECGEEFEINMWQNFTGPNGGVNVKYLCCPKCRRRRWCRGK